MPTSEPGSPPTAPRSVAERDASVGFVLRLGRAMHTYGAPSHRLEDLLEKVAARLGVPGQFFATPTSIFASFGEVEVQRTHLLRLDPGETHLENMAAIDAVGAEVLDGHLAPAAGSARIDAIRSAPARYRTGVTVLAFGLSSAAAARFLGGGLREIGVAAMLGLATGALAVLAGGMPRLRRVFEPLAATAAAAIATAVSVPLGGYAISISTLAGLLVLVPGLTLTIAMAELSARHLVAGTARIAGAGGLFLGIAFGVALGSRLGALAVGTPLAFEAAPLPAWTEWLALALAPISFTVLLRAHPAHTPWIMGVGALGFFAGRAGAAVLGPELGIVAGSFTAAVASNLLARVLDRPAAITLVPALLLLVPGSVGFRSLAALLDQQTLNGVETAFRMVMMLAALVAGLFSASLVVPARRWSE